MHKVLAVGVLLWLIRYGTLCRAASVSGYVIDKTDGSPILNATVSIEKTTISTFSDANGFYRLNRLPAGSYTVIVTRVGYHPYTQPLSINRDTTAVTFALEPLAVSLAEVRVRGFLTDGSDFQARQLEKTAPNLLNIVAAEAIERSSDITVADVTQRVSGLSVLRDNTGQTNKTIIRGIDPKYNYTLINGIKIPSPDDRGRYVPLDIFPADMVQRIEVHKSLTPGMEGDAIGGVINIVMKDAPREPVLNVKASTGYNQAFLNRPYTAFDATAVQPQSPAERYKPGYYATGADFTTANLLFRQTTPLPNLLTNLVWSRRFWQQRLGVILVADYQAIKRGASSFFIPQTTEPQLNNAPALTEYIRRDFSTTLIRKNIHARLDYAPGIHHKLSLYAFSMNQSEAETRFSVDTSLSQGRTVPGTGRISILQRARVHNQEIYSATLQGRHQLGRSLNAKWSAVYSVANGAYPDWAELTASTGRLEGANRMIQQTPLLLAPLTRSWLRNGEQETAAYLDLNYTLPVAGRRITLKTGGLFRRKNRTNFFTSYTFQPLITTGAGQPFTDINHAEWTNNNGPLNPLGVVANANTYSASEKIAAGYAAAQYQHNWVEMLAGLRLESTDQQFQSSVDPTVSIGREVTIQYTDLLPSVSVNMALSDRNTVRLAAFRSLSRPSLYDLTFYSIQYEDYIEAGNPFLKRARATTLELKYEHTPNKADLFQASVFYKKITDPYERALLNTSDVLYPIPDQGLSYTPAGQFTAQLKNFTPATLAGAELSLARYIGKVGLSANYTYTYSVIDQVKKYKTRAVPADLSSTIVTVSRLESRPLQGQSPHLANLSVSYAEPVLGLKGQVSAVYTGERIYSVSGWYGLDYWQRAYTQLDVSGEKKLGHWLVYLKVNNLLNATTRVTIRQPNVGFATADLPTQERADQITVMRQNDRATYYLGLKYTW